MTRNELIEVMARAICEEDHDGGDFGMMGIDAWGQPRARKAYIDRATAALTAIEAAGMRVVPADVAGLVERLTKLGKRREMEGIYTDQNICEAAASALQAQAAEIQALAMDALTAQGQAWENHDRAKAAEAKLREAVEVIQEARESIADLLSGCAKYGISTKGWLEDIDAFLATMEKTDDKG